MYGVILVRGQGARNAVSVQVLVPLQAGARRLNPSARAALTPQGLMGDGTLVHGVSVAQLGRGVARDAAQSGDEGSRVEMSREVLIGQSVHLLHGRHGAAAVRRDSRPAVATDVFQARWWLGRLRSAGVHARLPLARLGPVGGAGETQRLREAH